MTRESKEKHLFEIFLIVTVLGLTALLYHTAGYKMIVLNLFFLPVVLAAFFLGRYRAGVFCVLCIVGASVVTVMDLGSFATLRSPVVIGLAVTVWGAVLGLTALLVGTLSDERSNRLDELNDAYVGVIEVLSQYLQSANHSLRARSSRVAENSQRVAQDMRLPVSQLDDIRVAALLHDIEHLEITAKVIEKAVGTIEENRSSSEHTFNGTDLTHSLGGVLRGAFPLLLKQTDRTSGLAKGRTAESPLGARIIRTVRAFDKLVYGENAPGSTPLNAQDALALLRQDTLTGYDDAVLASIERVAIVGEFPSAPVDDVPVREFALR